MKERKKERKEDNIMTHNVNISEQESKETTPNPWQAKQAAMAPVASKENASNAQRELDDAALQEANGGFGIGTIIKYAAKGGRALVKTIRGK
jgi:hypothetical protein